jgi:hypothetical protein
VKHLPVGLAVGIKAIMFTPFPSGFQFGSGYPSPDGISSTPRAQSLLSIYEAVGRVNEKRTSEP